MDDKQKGMDDKQKGKKIDEAESSTKSTCYPGMWQFPSDPERCCIYRVPERLRRVNPEAYTPQLLLIGPLHHSLISKALKSVGDIPNPKLMGYVNTDNHKKVYLAEFAQRFKEINIIDYFTGMIEKNEKKIRENYSESTDWIKSQEFVTMILHDSIFIFEFVLRSMGIARSERGRDPLIDEPCHNMTVTEDLILLENQLPYFILKELFDPICSSSWGRTFRELIIAFFGFGDNIGNNSEFRHFTDLRRCVHVETLPHNAVGGLGILEHMYNAGKLHNGGVKFEAVNEKFSLKVTFENGCLKIPSLWIQDDSEMRLRNVMALEQCHYPKATHVCNYILFLDFLIDTDKDVDLFVKKGIIKNWIGQPNLVADMVNKLGMGIIACKSYYFDIAAQVNTHYLDPQKRSCAVLKRVYFSNFWIGTASVAAMVLLFLALIQTVFSVLQVVLKQPLLLPLKITQ